MRVRHNWVKDNGDLLELNLDQNPENNFIKYNGMYNCKLCILMNLFAKRVFIILSLLQITMSYQMNKRKLVSSQMLLLAVERNDWRKYIFTENIIFVSEKINYLCFACHDSWCLR